MPIITPKQGLSEKSLIGSTLVGSKPVGVKLNCKGCRYRIYDPLFKQLTLSLTVSSLGLVQGLVRFLNQLFHLYGFFVHQSPLKDRLVIFMEVSVDPLMVVQPISSTKDHLRC